MVTTLFSEALKPHWNKSERRRKPPGGFSADRASCSQGEGRQDGNRRHSWGRRWRLPIRACWTKKQIEIVFLFCKSTKHEKLSKEAVRSCVQRLCLFFLPHCQRINITKWGFCIEQENTIRLLFITFMSKADSQGHKRRWQMGMAPYFVVVESEEVQRRHLIYSGGNSGELVMV